ncbi:tetratricopeptide repeat protein [Streptomyces sp. NA04227]|uniref:AfsR/SARP family transcriptional regulator n=1 Tax=Streptomyces sp. NA04227 TaxID=2742136 RepID=UPI0015926EA9|nr:BTAD domain-containing putative transcriptional regulator [Streptomyces sp. NA04227]QKW10264.1 tetratricopeptide repeat protein [Streptomyces sp. NA04227]
MGDPTFGVLGPLQVRGAQGPVRVGGPKPRALLATLLLQPGRFVSVDVLTEVLWPGGAPRSAVANVRTYVHALRRTLSAAGIATDGLGTQPSGYTLDLPPEACDLLLFERRLHRARVARDEGDAAAALSGYESALALWRGGVLQDVPSSVVWDPAVAHLEERRASAADECLEVRLGLGDYAPLITELRTRLGEDPLREDLWQMLIRALHGAGRTAEARSAYARAAELLAAELGIEPGASLRALGEEINEYGRLGLRRPAPPAPVSQLPIDIPDFTGRREELAALEGLLSKAGGQPVVVVLTGPPGAGKSTLAVHAAHRMRHHFPDGQLFVDLGGMSGRPRDPAAVLAELLRGLGVHDSAVPAETAERAALFRSRLAQRRFLLVLDDAASSAQVRPLLPGTGGSAVLVSSRRRMPGLPAHHCPLVLMTREDARALLGAIVGSERLRAESTDADRVLDGCGSLPLAVRIAGSRLANRPGWSIGTLADCLDDERGRLDQLRTGDMEVRAGAELSYRYLPGPAATAFRAFGDLTEETVPGWLVAAAAGLADDAAGVLETLLDEHLVETVGADRLGLQRYRMHDLLRCCARELADREDSGVRLRRRLRVTDSLISLARTANSAMPTHFLGILGRPETPSGPAAAVAPRVRAAPLEWFESERRILVGGVESALRLGLVSRAADLAIELAGFFDLRFAYDDWLRTHQLVVDAMESPADVRAAALLRNLGQLHFYQDRYTKALASFDRSRAVFASLGHPSGEATATVGAGSVYRVRDELDAALRLFTEALHLFGAAGDRHGEAVACNAIASVWLKRQDPLSARPWLDDALRLAREVGDRHREAQVRRRIAALHQLCDQPALAQVELELALGIFDELADTHCAAYVQQSIGELYWRQGNAGRASALLAGALAVQQQLGDRPAEAQVACLLGELHHATGRETTARRYFHRSLSTYRRLGSRERAEVVGAHLRALR